MLNLQKYHLRKQGMKKVVNFNMIVKIYYLRKIGY
jgi:hypothetical protein